MMKKFSFLMAFLLLLRAFDVFAVDSSAAAERLELRQRLDSLEVEKQTLKRLGKPLFELETAASRLRDTLSAMRVQTTPSEQQSSSGKSFSLPFSLPSSLSGISFAPRNFFDWFIIATGVVALISGFLLVIGILHTARVKKRRAAAPKTKGAKNNATNNVSKRMNLAHQENHGAVPAPEIPKITPMPAQTSAAFGGYDFSAKRPGQLKTETQNKNEARGDEKTIALLRERILNAPAPEQQTASAPLFVSSDQLPQPSNAAVSSHELVIAASKEGLNAQEISKRHQISVDQVNLILRMANK
ncbi:MAG: hypothetical protein LBB56_04270 [Chitinispirillales bacterium]|jgi:hypothetical protein|nr:hypothetical protein [Chitinispirillales bacterium]